MIAKYTIGFIFIFPVAAWCQSAQMPATGENEKATSVIKKYLRPIDPAAPFEEYRSDILRKRLPKCRVFVRTDQPEEGRSSIFLLAPNDSMIDLGEDEWQKDTSGHLCAIRLTAFLASLKITVENTDEAIDLARLIEELNGAPEYIRFIKLNTENFSIFDRQFMEVAGRPEIDWKYEALPIPGGWSVTRNYVGLPACTMVPPVFEILIDNSNRFADLRIDFPMSPPLKP